METVQEYGFKDNGRIDAGGLVGPEGRQSAIKQVYLDKDAAHYGWTVVTRQIWKTGAGDWTAMAGHRWEPDPTVQVSAALEIIKQARVLADRAADILTQEGWEADAFTEAGVQEALKLQAEALKLSNAYEVITLKALAAQGM